STFKFDIVKALWSGISYTQLSNKHGIPRATIYKWEQTAKDAIIEAFENKTPGKRTTDLKEENLKLREQLRLLYHDKHRTAPDVEKMTSAESEPVICSKCSSNRIKKNGTVLTKRDGIRQRFTCISCSFSIYFDVKKTPPPSP
ncbi:MAG: transposase, partial [bacterium]